MKYTDFWKDKCVVISGASSGIGRAVAELLAQRGAKVGLLARRETLLSELAESINETGGQAAFAAVDVADREATRAAVGRIEEQNGPCDVAIANAGIFRKTDVTPFDAATAAAVIATNLTGAINLYEACLPAMVQRRRGNIAAVASIAAMIGMPQAGAYSASKAALVTLMQSLRVDLHPFGVKVTAICPGYVDTAILTDEERATRKDLLTPEQAGRRIAWAIERGRAEHWFPWRTWLLARIARALPAGSYRRIMVHVPIMEEAAVEE